MLNYSVHALETFGPWDLSGLAREDPSVAELLKYLDKGIKFELPVNGELLDEDNEKAYGLVDHTVLNLPFETVVLEFPFTKFIKNGDNMPAPKRIVICLDYTFHKNSYLAANALKKCPQLAEVGGILMFPVFEIRGSWHLSTWGLGIPRMDPEECSTSLHIYTVGNEPRMVSSKVGFVEIPVNLSQANQQIKQLGASKVRRDALRGCGEEATALLGLLAVLSCSNAKIIEVSVPTKLNIKRVKNGKLLYHSFNIVTIETPAALRKPNAYGASDFGKQSPREHLRRGHIRRLSSGNNIWVQSAIIGSGNQGRIDKYYKFK